jgi:hypothetical protein
VRIGSVLVDLIGGVDEVLEVSNGEVVLAEGGTWRTRSQSIGRDANAESTFDEVGGVLSGGEFEREEVVERERYHVENLVWR